MMTLTKFKNKYKHVKSKKFLSFLEKCVSMETERKILTLKIRDLNRKRSTIEVKISEHIDKLYLELEKLGEYKF
jgi:hypothetical protein